MKKLSAAIVITVFLAEMHCSCAYAEVVVDPGVVPGSSPPAGSQPGTPSHKPKHVYGNATHVRKLPGGIPPKNKSVVYDPDTSTFDNDNNRPSVPGNTGIINSPNSGNTGIALPPHGGR